MAADPWHFPRRKFTARPEGCAALRRLERLGLADTSTGGWALVDPEFAAWIREYDDGSV